jgi:hypothetical protein
MSSIRNYARTQFSGSAPIQLDEKQKGTVRHALSVAYEHFINDEKTFRKSAADVLKANANTAAEGSRQPLMDPQGFLNVAEQFKNQAADTLLLCKLFDGKEIHLVDEEGDDEDDGPSNARP